MSVENQRQRRRAANPERRTTAREAVVEEGETEETEEEEEEYVLCELPRRVRMLGGETLRFESLNGERPMLFAGDGAVYEGEYDRTIGEAMLVDSTKGAGGRKGKKGTARIVAVTETKLKFNEKIVGQWRQEDEDEEEDEHGWRRR